MIHQHWNVKKKNNERPVLLIVKRKPVVQVVDTRLIAESSFYELNGVQSAIYLACDEAMSINRLRDDFKGKGISHNALDKAIKYLVDMKLMLNTGNRILSLAINSSYLPFPKPAEYPLGLL